MYPDAFPRVSARYIYANTDAGRRGTFELPYKARKFISDYDDGATKRARFSFTALPVRVTAR